MQRVRNNPEDPEFQKRKSANAAGLSLLEKHKIPLIKLLVNVPQVFPAEFPNYPWTFPYEYQSFNDQISHQNVNRNCRYITFKVGTTLIPTNVEFEFDIQGYDKKGTITIEFDKIKRYLERSEYSEIMRLLVGFPHNDKELTKEIKFSKDLGGGCDITNMLFNKDRSKWKTINSYFPIYSSADNKFWVSAKAIDFYRLWDSQRKLEYERRRRRQAYKRTLLPSDKKIKF